MQLEGTDINKNNNKYRKDNFESFIFNLVREFDITINAAVSSSNQEGRIYVKEGGPKHFQ